MGDPSRCTFFKRIFYQITRQSCQAILLFLFSIAWHLIMERLNNEQRLQIIQLCYENSRFVKSLASVVSLLRVLFATLAPILSRSIHYWIISDQIDHVQNAVKKI